MPQFPHEEVAFESGINVRFTIYNSNNDYIPEHWHRSMEVIYIYEGSMELIEGQRVLLLHAGDYHVVNSAAVHATRTTTPRFGPSQLLEVSVFHFVRRCFHSHNWLYNFSQISFLI